MDISFFPGGCQAKTRLRKELYHQRLKSQNPHLSIVFRMIKTLRLVIRKLGDALAQLLYLPMAFGWVWAAARRWMVAWARLLLV